MATFNSAVDVMCLTSLNEGTPVSLIEAQASGIPVVTTDVGGVKDIVLEGDTGFVVPLENKEMFANRVLEIANNENKREKNVTKRMEPRRRKNSIMVLWLKTRPICIWNY